MTASHDQQPASWPPPSVPDASLRTRLDRFKNEVAAGGSSDNRPSEAPGGGVRGLVTGLAILALIAWLAVANLWMFVFLIGILVSVFLHETGHYLTARATGMKVTQFFIGFGPRVWSFQRGETEYGVRVLPLGAFVRIIGMNNLDEVDPADEARTYRQKSYPRRMLVISAGSMMHICIAAVLFFAVFATRWCLVDAPGAEVSQVTEAVRPPQRASRTAT